MIKNELIDLKELKYFEIRKFFFARNNYENPPLIDSGNHLVFIARGTLRCTSILRQAQSYMAGVMTRVRCRLVRLTSYVQSDADKCKHVCEKIEK